MVTTAEAAGSDGANGGGATCEKTGDTALHSSAAQIIALAVNAVFVCTLFPSADEHAAIIAEVSFSDCEIVCRGKWCLGSGIGGFMSSPITGGARCHFCPCHRRENVLRLGELESN